MYLNYYATDVDSFASKLRFYSLVVGVVVVASRHSDANMQTGIIVEVRLPVPTPTFSSQKNKKFGCTLCCCHTGTPGPNE